MKILPRIFKKINFHVETIDEKKHYGKFVFEPLEKGFGITIGNALRRILLSAIPGGSIFAVEIDGVRHEFSSLENVNEDVMTIILNLKKLILKIDDDSGDTKKLEINKKGPCTIYAKDIVCPDLVKVVNSDLEIAHLVGKSNFHMILYARSGRGYVTAETNKIIDEQQIGFINTDSNYSPIKNVSFAVELTRVKQGSHFDKLVFEVQTNGSIEPQNAIVEAANILISHLKQIMNLCDNTNKNTKNNTNTSKNIKFEETPVIKKTSEKDNIKKMSIEDLDFSARSDNFLKRANINNVGDLISKTEDEIMEIKCLGKKSLDEIKKKLKSLGLSFKNYSKGSK